MNEPRIFTLIRNFDQSGISGTGRVLDGVVFHNGQVVICWRSDVNVDKLGFTSLGIYPSWDAFMHVHVLPHSANQTEIRFLDREVDAKGPAK